MRLSQVVLVADRGSNLHIVNVTPDLREEFANLQKFNVQFHKYEPKPHVQCHEGQQCSLKGPLDERQNKAVIAKLRVEIGIFLPMNTKCGVDSHRKQLVYMAHYY